MEDLYGPPLPPGYVRPDDSEEDSNESKTSSKSNTDGGTKIIGPQIPRFLSRKRSHSSSSENEPRPKQEEKTSNIGPQLPAELRSRMSDESGDDEAYGPLPVPSDLEISHVDDARVSIEKRAKKMKNQLDNKDLPTVNTIQREEWMTVPDTSRKNQLGAISRCLAPEEKSSSKSKKHSHYHNKEKDKETTEELKKYNKAKRAESLLEMHQKDKKSKDKKSSKDKNERKAFDRDEIEVKHFSKQQVNSVIDKAKYLNSRFSAGAKRKLILKQPS